MEKCQLLITFLKCCITSCIVNVFAVTSQKYNCFQMNNYIRNVYCSFEVIRITRMNTVIHFSYEHCDDCERMLF